MYKIDPSVNVIAFTGRARSGKDTAARLLAKRISDYNNLVTFPNQYVIGAEAFAGPIKSMVAMLLDYFGKGAVSDYEKLKPYIDGEFKEEIIEDIGASPRTLMQTLGTEWGRDMINEDIWVNSMLARLQGYNAAKEHGYKGAYVFITDCRYDNEARALKSKGIPIVEILRESKAPVASHKSEDGISGEFINFTLVNDREEIDLAGALEYTLKDYLPEWPSEEERAQMAEEYYGEDNVILEGEFNNAN